MEVRIRYAPMPKKIKNPKGDGIGEEASPSSPPAKTIAPRINAKPSQPLERLLSIA